MPTPKRMRGTPRSEIPSRTARVAGSTKRRYSSGDSDPGPAVEELDGLGARLDLGAQEGHRHGGQPVDQLAPQRRVAVHERLDLGEGPGRPALDQVAGDGEGCTGEADEGDTAAGELAGDEADGVDDVGGIEARARVGAGVRGRRRCGTARPPPGLGRARRRRRSRWRAPAPRCRRRGWRRPRRSGARAGASARRPARRRRWPSGSIPRRVRPGTRAVTAPPGA